MTAVRSTKNQYRGINAHLHSYWQSRGGWNRFHGNHIADLMRLLSAELIPMGYVAELESSIQIRYLNSPDSAPESSVPESDITIYDADPVRSLEGNASASAAPGVLILPAADVLAAPVQSEKELHAVVLYEIEQTEREPGTPVAWFELLSPSNKGSGPDAETYRQKRTKIVQSGLVFVEIDYLHESGSTLQRVANYRVRGGSTPPPNAHPYRIVVIDPRPSYFEGRAYLAEFDVDAPIPTAPIPLNGNDVLHFDFGAPYRKTFEETLYGWRLVDYSQFPERYDRYSPADQQRIAQRMVAVLEAARAGKDLETGPFPVETMRQEEALRRIEVLRT